MRFLLMACVCLALLCGSVCVAAPVTKAPLTVFAAASTTNALTDIGKLYEAKGHGPVTFSFGSSSTLAKQIENGAPAQVFLSADEGWMNYLEGKSLLHKGSRINLLGNRIVLIGPAKSPVASVAITQNVDLVALLGADGRLAVGDPAHVPVGKYAKAALEQFHLWDAVASRLALAKDVRAGMALVERGEAPLGIVYASDAATSTQVKVVGVFPENSHPPVVYPVAATVQKDVPPALAFIEFLRSDAAKAIWLQYGFEVR